LETAPNLVELWDTLTAYGDLGKEAERSLPGSFYVSPALFDHEVETLLGAEWICLGRGDEIPEPGDYFTQEVLGEPLLVVRGDDRAIRVLANVCRHRSSPVADGAGNRKFFVCPYHAWSYGRDGSLRRAPRMDRARLDKTTCRLPRYPSEIWAGFIYVNIDGRATSLAPRLMALETLLANYHTGEMRFVHRGAETWRVNWKSLVENFIEAYHLSVVHSKTLHEITPTALAKKFTGGAGYTGYFSNYPKNQPSRGRGHPDLTPEERHRSTLFSIFPCHLVSQAAGLLVSLMLYPSSVDFVRVCWTMSVHGQDFSDAEIAELIALWTRINEEDRAKLEAVQRGLGSRHAEPGPLAPSDYEGTIREFYRYLAHTLPRPG